MNVEQLEGPGASIAIRAYESVNEKYGAKIEEFLFLTTENNPVSGKLNDHVEELFVPCFNRKTVCLIIFVGLRHHRRSEV